MKTKKTMLFVVFACLTLLAGIAHAELLDGPFTFPLSGPESGLYSGAMGPRCGDGTGRPLRKGTPVYIMWSIPFTSGTGKGQVSVSGGDINHFILYPYIDFETVSKAAVIDNQGGVNVSVTFSDYTGPSAPTLSALDCFKAL